MSSRLFGVAQVTSTRGEQFAIHPVEWTSVAIAT